MVKKNILSIFVALIIMYLSLSPSDTYENISFADIPFLDKSVHFSMYFILMSVIIYENRKGFKSTGQLLLISLIPFCFGILMEILQSIFIVSRTGSFYDVIFNSAGILFSLILCLLIKPNNKQLFK